MHFVRTAVAAVVVGLTAGAASAATVSAAKGQVSINRGSGYAKFSGVITAKAGDRVMVGQDGAATITFGNGCLLPVEAGAVVVIPEDAMCVPGARGVSGAMHDPYIIGGLVVAAGVGIAVAVGGGSSGGSGGSTPASP